MSLGRQIIEHTTAHLVYIERVPSRRKALRLCHDQNSLRRFLEGYLAYGLTRRRGQQGRGGSIGLRHFLPVGLIEDITKCKDDDQAENYDENGWACLLVNKILSGDPKRQGMTTLARVRQ